MKELVISRTTIVGPDEHVANALRTASERGQLVTRPENITPISRGGGVYEVRVSMVSEQDVPFRRAVALRLGAVAHAFRTRSDAVRDWDARNPVTSALTQALTFAAFVAGVGAAAVMLAVHLVRTAFAGVDWTVALGWTALVFLGAALLARVVSGTDGHRSGWGYHYTRCKK